MEGLIPKEENTTGNLVDLLSETTISKVATSPESQKRIVNISPILDKDAVEKLVNLTKTG